jgi:hypothetical protein
MVNDKSAATYHPARKGYTVTCDQCGDPNLFSSLWRDVAERFAEQHENTRGHQCDVLEGMTR